MSLDDAIAMLYTREINCGCETFWDGGIKVWIGDTMNGHDSEMPFDRGLMCSRLGGRSGICIV
jgi:hypothetical protein